MALSLAPLGPYAARVPAEPDDDAQLLDRLAWLEGLLERVDPDVLGHRLRRFRTQQGLSIREVADRARVSKNSIVRLERGGGTLPITILKVCSVLGVHAERLAGPGAPDLVLAAVHRTADDRWYDAGDMGSAPLAGGDRPLDIEERRAAVEAGASTPVNLLRSRLPGGRALPSVLELWKPSPERSHVGEELVYVLEGRAAITVGGTRHELGPGESIVFWSAEPHSYAPADPERIPARILSVRLDG